MFNHDVIDLYNRIPLGTRIVVRTYEDSVRIEGPALANRGIQLPAYISSEGVSYAVSRASARRCPRR